INMKKVNVVLVCAFVFAANVAMAQKSDSVKSFNHRHGDRAHGIPNLTEDQKKKIADIKTPVAKDVLQLNNQLGEKRARLKTLQSADKADQSAINATIDDISKLQAQVMKKRAAERQAIRTVLTDEQRLAFDRQDREGKGRGRGHGGHGHNGHRHGKKG